MKNRSLYIILFAFSFTSIQAQAGCSDWPIFSGFCTTVASWFSPSKADRTSGQIRNASNETEGTFCPECRAAAAGRASNSLGAIPQRGPASGAYKVMQTMLGTCNIQALDRLPNPPKNTCNTDPSYDSRIRCGHPDANGRTVTGTPVVLTPTSNDLWSRRINSSYNNIYQSSGQCNGVHAYSGMKVTFAMPSNFGVQNDSQGRPVIDLAHSSSPRGIDPASVPVVAPECAKYLHASFLANGLKIAENEKVVAGPNGDMMLKIGNENRWVSTGLFSELANKPSSCVKHASVNLANLYSGAGTEPFISGDVISDGEGQHSWMITKVKGTDPLGIAKLIKSGRKCHSLNFNDFSNFEMTQSTGANNVGPIIATVEAFREERLPNGPLKPPIVALLATAKNLCAKAVKYKDTPSRTTTKNPDLPKFSIIRHKSVSGDDPEGKCSYSEAERPRIKGEECGQRCNGETPAPPAVSMSFLKGVARV